MSVLYDTIQRGYNATIRSYLPRKWGVVAGVPVRDFRLLDRQDWQPGKMIGFITAIEENVSPGDVVVDVASGRGIAAVTAARADAETVRSYEASGDMVSLARETVNANRVDDVVTVHHAVVGETRNVWGKMYGADVLAPDDLPLCDVLQLDCEGAELSILNGIDQGPQTIIVETHPVFDSPTKPCVIKLEEMGYEINLRYYQDGEPEKDVIVARK